MIEIYNMPRTNKRGTKRARRDAIELGGYSTGRLTVATDLDFKNNAMTVPFRIPRGIPEMLHWFRANASYGTITSNNAAAVETNLSFRLTDCDLSGGLSALFDQYAIVELVVELLPKQNAIAESTPSGSIWTALDFDNTTNVGLAGIRAFSSAVRSAAYEPIRRVLQPRVAVSVYKGAFTAFANQRSWIDSGNTDVNHYGFRSVVEISANAVAWDVMATMAIVTRNVL